MSGSTGAGEPYAGLQAGDGGPGEPAGAEGAEPAAGRAGLRGDDRPGPGAGAEGEGEGEGGGREGDAVSPSLRFNCAQHEWSSPSTHVEHG